MDTGTPRGTPPPDDTKTDDEDAVAVLAASLVGALQIGVEHALRGITSDAGGSGGQAEWSREWRVRGMVWTEAWLPLGPAMDALSQALVQTPSLFVMQPWADNTDSKGKSWGLPIDEVVEAVMRSPPIFLPGGVAKKGSKEAVTAPVAVTLAALAIDAARLRRLPGAHRETAAGGRAGRAIRARMPDDRSRGPSPGSTTTATLSAADSAVARASVRVELVAALEYASTVVSRARQTGGSALTRLLEQCAKRIAARATTNNNNTICALPNASCPIAPALRVDVSREDRPRESAAEDNDDDDDDGIDEDEEGRAWFKKRRSQLWVRQQANLAAASTATVPCSPLAQREAEAMEAVRLVDTHLAFVPQQCPPKQRAHGDQDVVGRASDQFQRCQPCEIERSDRSGSGSVDEFDGEFPPRSALLTMVSHSVPPGSVGLGGGDADEDGGSEDTSMPPPGWFFNHVARVAVHVRPASDSVLCAEATRAPHHVFLAHASDI